MKRSLTEELKRSLKLNGYFTRDDGNSFEKSGDRRWKSITFLGHGWVDIYEREYPASEGWGMFKVTVGEALKHHVPL